VDGGWTIEESIELASKLKWEGVDIIDCSSGGAIPGVKYPAGASWQVPFAAEIKNQAGIPTAAVGMIVEPMQADAIIRNQRVDIVLLGREMLRNPYWPVHAAKVLKKTHLLKLPRQYDYVIGG
jgi:2,4-dienoyl-CoA reductase-like NADH-dependent reductase (Old Yellow Enzyme family)